MLRWPWERGTNLWFAAALCGATVTCGGKSIPERSQGLEGSAGRRGGVSGWGGGGGAADSCTFNGVHYEIGERFGNCNECECTQYGGISCLLILCPESGGGGGGGSSGASAGTGESGGTSSGQAGSSALGGAGAGGLLGGAGSGGAGSAGSGSAGSANGGGAGDSSAGAGGEGTSPNECTITPAALVCVVGTVRDGEEVLEVGAPLKLSMRASGCHSSSCTELEETYCNYLTDQSTIFLSGYLCLASTGDGACTDDCGGVGSVECEPGLELEEGDFSLSFGSATIRFSVPSVVPPQGLCASSEDG
jgi:hypothetical protein